MLDIDQLKFDFYNELAHYIASLCDGAKVIDNRPEYRRYRIGSRLTYTIIKNPWYIILSYKLDELIAKKFELNVLNNSDNYLNIEQLYNTPQLRDMLIPLICK